MQLLETRRSTRRKPRWIKFAALILLAAVAIGGWQAWEKGRPRYLLWKQAKALEQARQFIEKRDAPNAQLALEVALKTVPGNPETIRVAADMLEQVGSPQAMRLRRAVVLAAPDSAEDAAKLVLCCLKFSDFNAAKDALAATPAAVADQPPMLQAALAFALATANAPVADLLIDRLRAEQPENEALPHAQAVLRLRHPEEEQRNAARRELQELAQRRPALTLQINRELASDALQRRDYEELKRRQSVILADVGATFTDYLQKANVDLLVDHVPFETVFAELAPLATSHEKDVAQLAQWLLVQARQKEADAWLGQLPDALRHQPAVQAVRAEVVAQLRDWDRLAPLLQSGAWGAIPAETLRLAMAAHTVDSPTRLSLRRETWEMTLESCTGNLSALRVLQRLASLWQWQDETERTLWAIARTFPMQTWAHQTLFNIYRTRKDTPRMREVMGILRDSEGSVPRYQHDWALLTLLTEPNSNWNPAKEIMHKLHEADARDATYRTGYAFALAQAGKSTEALDVVASMTAAERQYPPRQPYLAFVYGVGKKAAELEATLAQGKDVNYLPEESYLFTRAREELNRKPNKPKSGTTQNRDAATTNSES